MPLTVHDLTYLPIQSIEGLWITNVTDPIRDGLLVTLAGANLSTVANVYINDTSQVIVSQTDDEITFTADIGGIPYGAVSVRIESVSDATARSSRVIPLSGRDYVTVSGYPPPDGQESILDHYDDVEAGDQIEYAITSSQQESVTVNPDGTFKIDGDVPQSFQYRLWDATDGTWSSFGAVQVNMALRTPDRRRIRIPGRENTIVMPP